jgi:Ca2+/Na+ antiporter
MNFDPQIALNYAASISRPRRVGTGTDEEVAAEITEKLRGWGYEIERQPFTFSTAPNVFLTLVVLAAILLVLFMLLAYERLSIVSDIAALALLLLVVLFMPLNRQVQSAALERNGRGLKWGRRYTTANLIASRNRVSTVQNLASPTGRTPVSNLPHLYLIAHYDSKSQHLPLAVRIALFMLAIIAGLILVALTLLDVSTVFYLPIGFFALAVACPLLFLDVGNNSPGAIDNASSVGLVLHLAEVLAQRTDWQDRLCLTILIPSAEEMTLMGSVAYVTTHEEMLHEQDQSGGLYVLNFDGVGIDGELYYVGHSHQSHNSDRPNLLTHAQNACADLGLPLKRFSFIGALFDHIPFAQRGLDAISLIAVGQASRSVHTPADSIDKLHVRGFDQAGRAALRVIEQIIK